MRWTMAMIVAVSLIGSAVPAQGDAQRAKDEYEAWSKTEAGKKALEEMTSPRSRLQLRLVLDEGDKADADEFEDRVAGKIRVSRHVLLNEKAVARAYPAPTPDGRTAVGANLTEAGGRQMHWITSRNIARKLAIVFDGRLITAPMIRSAIRDTLVIDGGTAGFTDADREAIIKALNAGREGK